MVSDLMDHRTDVQTILCGAVLFQDGHPDVRTSPLQLNKINVSLNRTVPDRLKVASLAGGTLAKKESLPRKAKTLHLSRTCSGSEPLQTSEPVGEEHV